LVGLNVITIPGLDTRVVIVESAIDATSHVRLTGDCNANYLKTGSMRYRQRELVGAVLVTNQDEAKQKAVRRII
jgi:hypothetical protein